METFDRKKALECQKETSQMFKDGMAGPAEGLVPQEKLQREVDKVMEFARQSPNCREVDVAPFCLPIDNNKTSCSTAVFAKDKPGRAI